MRSLLRPTEPTQHQLDRVNSWPDRKCLPVGIYSSAVFRLSKNTFCLCVCELKPCISHITLTTVVFSREEERYNVREILFSAFKDDFIGDV